MLLCYKLEEVRCEAATTADCHLQSVSLEHMCSKRKIERISIKGKKIIYKITNIFLNMHLSVYAYFLNLWKHLTIAAMLLNADHLLNLPPSSFFEGIGNILRFISLQKLKNSLLNLLRKRGILFAKFLGWLVRKHAVIPSIRK